MPRERGVLTRDTQSTARPFDMQRQDLLTKHEIFDEQGLTGTKEANDHTKTEPHQIEHSSFDSRLPG